MKFSNIIFSSLPAAASAAKGIHLRQTTPIVPETTLDVFESVVQVLEQCPDEAAALATCYGGDTPMLACGTCAWTRVLSEINQGCDGIDGIAVADYQSCIDSPTSVCNDECNDEATAAWKCAKAMYCGSGMPDEFEETDRETCFSLESTVVVEGKGLISMKDLAVGDMVLSDEHGSYSKFYSWGHLNKNVPTQFLRIYTEISTKPLELTHNHLIYKASDDMPVPASSIKVGDVLKTAADGPAKVTFVKTITRKGILNPFTLSGSIVVDGIVASNHVELPGFSGGQNAGWGYLGPFKAIHWHTFTQVALSPHRVICGYLMSCSDDLTEDGKIPYGAFLHKVHAAAEEKQSVLFTVAVLMFIFVQVGFFQVLELLMQNFLAVALVAAGGWFYFKGVSRKVKEKTA